MRINRKYSIGIGIIALLVVGYFIADSLLYNGVRPIAINENGFRANYFIKNNTQSKAAVVLIGGGPWGDYWGQQCATVGYVGLSLPYTLMEGLPTLPEEIDLEYFERALEWLAKQPEVDPNKIVVMGASRNAELSLVLASNMPKLISGVVAYAPSSVSWSNTVLPFNSDSLKPSWKYRGADIPYIPMDKILGNDSNKIETLAYWGSGLAKNEYLTQASIKVENIQGPILLFSGKDDMVWPSSLMADMIQQRLKQHHFKYPFQSIKYDNAGHLISGNPETDHGPRTGIITIKGKDYEYNYGGTSEGDKFAQKDAKMRLFHFLEKIN